MKRLHGNRQSSDYSIQDAVLHKRRRSISNPRLSALESLPTELLETIFLQSCNGNLLLTSSKIATRLSHSQTLFRVAFLISFYNHQLEDAFRILDLEQHLPTLDLPIQSWEYRSMTKAVLRSRWCTAGWIKSFLALLKAAAELDSYSTMSHGGTRVFHIKNFAIPTSVRFAHLESRYQKLRICDTVPTESFVPLGLDDFSFSIEELQDPEFPHDIESSSRDMMDLDSDEDEEDEEDDEHPEDLGLNDFDALIEEDPNSEQWQWRFCGAVRPDCRTKIPSHDATTPFRDLIWHIAGSRYTWSGLTDPFAALQHQIQTSRLSYTQENYSLWEQLALDYFHYPEDQPFKIPPYLFTIAAAQDMATSSITDEDPEILPDFLSYASFAHLFTLDPRSLPTKDPVIEQYGLFLVDRLRSLIKDRLINRDIMRSVATAVAAITPKPTGVPTLRRSLRTQAIAWSLRNAHMQLVTENILTYLTFNTLPENANNDLLRPLLSCHHHPFSPHSPLSPKGHPVSAYIASAKEGSIRNMLGNQHALLSQHPMLRNLFVAWEGAFRSSPDWESFPWYVRDSELDHDAEEIDALGDGRASRRVMYRFRVLPHLRDAVVENVSSRDVLSLQETTHPVLKDEKVMRALNDGHVPDDQHWGTWGWVWPDWLNEFEYERQLDVRSDRVGDTFGGNWVVNTA